MLEKKICLFKHEEVYTQLRDALFFHAVGVNAFRIMKHFLNQGFNLGTRSSVWFDRTPLHHALACASINTIHFLIDNGAQLDAKDRLGNTPLHLAAQRGLFSMVQMLLKKGICIDECDEHNYTPLHNAVEQGHVKITRFLLKAGANVNAQTCNGDTPLHLALVSYAHHPGKKMFKKRLKSIIKILGTCKPDLTKSEIYNRWTVFDVLNNLDLAKREQKRLFTLLTEIKNHSRE